MQTAMRLTIYAKMMQFQVRQSIYAGRCTQMGLGRMISSSGIRAIHNTKILCSNEMDKKFIQEADDASFDRLVLKSKIPVLVDFYADWCGPCRMISPILTKLVNQQKGKLKLVKVNVDDNNDTAGTYQVSALPTVVSFHKGKELDRFIGMKDEASMRRFIEALLDESQKSQ